MNSRKSKSPPFETKELRESLKLYFETPFHGRKVGNYKYGAYAFFDYDGEPIYVGQTVESLRTRIRRHLTNQRTDAVAMSVLDPFEVFSIEVWPLRDMEGREKKNPELRNLLNALECRVFEKAIEESSFGAVLNEKRPNDSGVTMELPESFKASIVSDKVFELRAHPDIRIARRALILSRLAQVISERQVQPGLRHTLAVQAKRLEFLAESRLDDQP
jgi:GIY-YIG catalytic domain